MPAKGKRAAHDSRSAVVHEIDGKIKLKALDKVDALLEVVLALAADSNFVSLNLGLHFDSLILDLLDERLGLILRNAFLEFDLLFDRHSARGLFFRVVDLSRIDSALHEFAKNNVSHLLELALVATDQSDLVLLENDFGVRALEVEAVHEFLLGLVDCIADFLLVYT